MLSRRAATKLLAASLAAPSLAAMGRAAQAATKISIAEGLHVGMFGSLYVAADQGLFAKHGIEGQIVSAGGVALPVPILLSGRGEVAVTAPGMSINAMREGARFVNIAKIVGGVSMWGVARPGAGIRSVKDLAGKTIATLKFPSSTIQVPTHAMKTVGFDPEANHVKFLELPTGAQLAAVKDGRADLATVFEWDASIGVQDFGLETVLSFSDLLGPLPFSTAFVTRDYATANPQAVQAFCNAIAAAQKMIHEDHSMFAAVSKKQFPDVKPAVIENAVANFLSSSSIPKNPVITPEEWQRDMQLETVGGAVKSAMAFEDIVDMSFAKKATADFGLKA